MPDRHPKHPSIAICGLAFSLFLAACGDSHDAEVTGASSTSADSASATSSGGESSGGGSTGGASGQATSGGTSGGVCNRPDAGELTVCTGDSQCGCGLSCVSDPILGASFCEYDCQQTSDCASTAEVCKDGSCQQNYCGPFAVINNGQFDGPCNVVDAGDGFCYPFFEGGETLGICQLAGTAAIGASCLSMAVRTSSPSLLCGTDALCHGDCLLACDPLQINVCPAGQICNPFGGESSPHLGSCVVGQAYDGGYAAPHLPSPQLPYNGGPLISSPKLVTMSFPGYQDGGFPISAYADWIVGSSWLKAVGADYGLGLGHHIQDFVFPSAAPIQVSDSEIQQMLSHWIQDGGIPAPDSETIYMVYYPSTSTVSMAEGSASCQTFFGYHGQFALSDGTPVTYGVVATCPPQNDQPALDAVSITTSHELVEAATDPDPQGKNGSPGYKFGDFTMAWTYTFAEAADLCVGSLGTYDGFPAQRIWSNTAARLGSTSPCIPVPAGEVYLNASALPNGTQYLSTSSSEQIVTFQITPWSLAPTSEWYLDVSPLAGTFQPSLTLSGGTPVAATVVQVNNGDPLTLQVTIPPGIPSGSYVGLQLASDPNTSLLNYTLWPIAIVIE